jgi:hypothetical protein
MSRIALTVLLITIVGSAPAGRTAATTGKAVGSCRLVVDAPFLYVDTVIPVSSVQCDEPVRRLRVVTSLIQDQIDAAEATRMCRDTSICWLTVDASAPDIPGDQVWCTRAVGYYENNRILAEATVCESDQF